jgi:SAM-dependent methyltransferase
MSILKDLKLSYKEDISKITKKNVIRMERAFDTFKDLIELFYKENIFDNKYALDLGEGDKSFVKVLESKKFKVKGFDIDTIDFEKDPLPEQDNSVDIIFCNSVVEHISNISNFFSEIYRVLKKGGILIVVTPNFTYDYKNFYDDPTHINPFTVNKLTEVLKLFNFNKIKIVPWVVKKSVFFWKIPFKFFVCRYFLIASNDTNIPIPSFFKGQTKSILSISKK